MHRFVRTVVIILLCLIVSEYLNAENIRHEASLSPFATQSSTRMPSNIFSYTTPDNLPKGVPWFITENSGTVWLAGDSALIAKASSSDLTKWTLMNTGIPSGAEINWLEFASSQIIFAAGGNGTIYKTINGGYSWTVSYSDTGWTQFINIIKFFDASHGAACGDGTQGGLMAFLETTDGGITWKNNNFSLVGAANYNLVRYAAPSSVFMSGYLNSTNGKTYRGIWRSTDLGASWGFSTVGSATALDSTTVTLGVDFRSTLVGIACRRDSTFWSTSDGGVTWQQLGQRSPTYFYSLDFVEGTASAMSGGARQASLAELTLSPPSFTVQRKDTSVAEFRTTGFTFVNFPTTTRGYMINGGKLRTFYTTQSPTYAGLGLTLPTHFSIEQNYPNPFNPSTIIRYQLPTSNLVTLKIYDMLGRELSTLVNEQQNAGRHEVIFDGSQIASGVYFYRFRAGEFIQTRKFVLQK